MGPTLMLLGASVRAAAQSAARAGFSPWAADLFADVDLRACCSARRVRGWPDGLLEAAREADPGPWLYTGALENHPALVDAIARERPLYGNPGPVLRRIRDPLAVRETLDRNGLPCPDCRLSADGLPRDGSWLCKPRASSGGRHIGPLTDAFDRCVDRSWYFQRRVEGVSCAAVFVAAGGKAVLCGVTRQLVGCDWAGGRDHWYCGSLGLLPISESARRSLIELGNCLSASFGLVGLFGVDALLEGDTVWPVEINPRYPASVEILERAGGLSAIGAHVAACRDGRLPAFAVLESDRRCGKIILYAPRPVTVGSGLSERFVATRASDHGPQVADIPAPGTSIGAGRPAVTLLADGPDEHTVIDELRRRADALRASF